jgi:hypothetical protein
MMTVSVSSVTERIIIRPVVCLGDWKGTAMENSLISLSRVPE